MSSKKLRVPSFATEAGADVFTSTQANIYVQNGLLIVDLRDESITHLHQNITLSISEDNKSLFVKAQKIEHKFYNKAHPHLAPDVNKVCPEHLKIKRNWFTGKSKPVIAEEGWVEMMHPQWTSYTSNHFVIIGL